MYKLEACACKLYFKKEITHGHGHGHDLCECDDIYLYYVDISISSGDMATFYIHIGSYRNPNIFYIIC